MSNRNHFWGILVFVLYLLIASAVIAAAALTYIYKYSSDKSLLDLICLISLLASPLFIQFIGWFFIQDKRATATDILHVSHLGNISPETKKDIDHDSAAATNFCNFYNFTMFISVTSYGLMWIFYSAGRRSNFLSALCLFFIFLEITVIVFSTYIMMQAPLTASPGLPKKGWLKLYEDIKKHYGAWCQEFRSGLHMFPFWRFVHFFAIFMSISFLFGFAFAFHDEGLRIEGGETGLYIENLKSSPESAQPRDESNDKPDISRPLESGKEVLQTKRIDMGCFYFDPGKAKLRNGENNNEKSLKELTEKMSLFQPKQLLRVNLVGRADETVIGDKASSYLSNYELSEARTGVVKNEIIRKLLETGKYFTWRNVEWSAIPYSNELIGNPALFRRCDVIKENDFLDALAAGNDVISKQIKGKLSDREKKIISAEAESRRALLLSEGSCMSEFINKIVDHLNQLVADNEFYKKNVVDSDDFYKKNKNEIDQMLKSKKVGITEVSRAFVENSFKEKLASQVLPQLLKKDLQKKIEQGKPDNFPSLSSSRVVEVSIEVVEGDPTTQTIAKALNSDYTPDIMDYLYFSIYTITTTGYGDIKPVSTYSKFLVSLENFFEVFFLVCFMNILIAMKRDIRGPESTENPEEADNRIIVASK